MIVFSTLGQLLYHLLFSACFILVQSFFIQDSVDQNKHKDVFMLQHSEICKCVIYVLYDLYDHYKDGNFHCLEISCSVYVHAGMIRTPCG